MTPPRKLFGTDGVRGVAGELLSAELALALGRAAAFESTADRPQVLVVRDTRESGPMLEAALASGVTAEGGEAFVGGVLPTPAASVLVRRLGLDFAAVVSASHNPWRDNGIKFFGADGRKLGPEAEARIERSVSSSAPVEAPGSAEIGRLRELDGGLGDYLRELERAFPLDLAGVRVVLDCANGATYRAAPQIFTRLGAEVETMFTDPDGRNINDGCGSTHPGALARRVAESGADVGFAFDGDGDRLAAVDSTGAVRDGDELIAIAATYLHRRGELGGGVAVTVMSNLGFHHAMRDAGIEVATTPVGDRSVSTELSARDWVLGGEQSGHLIWTDFAPSGDGIAAALLTLGALGGTPLADVRPIVRLPQVLENVEVADRDAAGDAPALRDAVERESAELGASGRILVRPSGTEPLVRVMVEAPELDRAQAICTRLADVIRSELG